MPVRPGTEVLIIGAGPFGLSLAAHLRDLGVDHVLAGRPMSFWREHMPAGMLLRSGLDWHLDVAGEATLDAFVREAGMDEATVMPLSRDRYLDYVDWFTNRKQLVVTPFVAESLTVENDGGFTARSSEEAISAKAVVIATGFRDHANVPAETAAMLPEGARGHTCDIVDFERFNGQRVLIVGGRQSAFESAALLAEAGAHMVDVVYRHETPAFTASDWSWVDALMQRTEREAGWYRALSEDARKELNGRFWAEGRLKLEPWLAPRIAGPNVHLHPGDEIASVRAINDGLEVELKSGVRVAADFVLFATGYRVDIARVPFLSAGLLEQIETKNGFPTLDTALQSSVPGLYFTSIAATQDFGPFFGFTVSARSSARLIGASLVKRRRDT